MEIIRKVIISGITILIFFLLASKVTAQSESVKDNYLWINKMNQIQVLDNLIENAHSVALDIKDYERLILKNIINKNYTLNSATDSLVAENKIRTIAIQFFSDLAFGNKLPQISYNGIKFNTKYIDISNQLNFHLERNSLLTFYTELRNSSKEVEKILNLLNEYQKSKNEDKGKINTLIIAANNYRWLNAIRKNNKIILVNIPSANLKVFENDSTLLSMKLILGKKKTPTSTLTSYITEVIVNPYWTVPKSIATKELLPLIKKNINYINHARLQVLNSNGKIISPYSVNWHNLSIGNFPYTLRQSTGCDNSLGILKLNFNSPFGIFLHDTPEKQLFTMVNRYYSHGCIRMEKPIEIAKIIMQKNKVALDTIDFKNCYKRPSPIILTLPQKIPIVIWYNLVDFNNEGKLNIYFNIYNRNIY